MIRHRTLRHILLAIALLAAFTWPLGPSSTALRAQGPGTRSQNWVQDSAADFGAGQLAHTAIADLGGGQVVLAAGAIAGQYTSPIVEAAFPFVAIAPHWRASLPPGAALRVELRVYAGGTWSDWFPIDQVAWDPARGQFYPDDPVLTWEGRQFQYRLTMLATAGGASPALEAMVITYIDSTTGPTTLQAREAALQGDGAPGSVPRPAIIPRAAWGADESLMTWPPEYRNVAKVVVHHTATRNDYLESEGASLVRAIYRYHAEERGWGDIGYNYLVDRYGNLYEGRYGGPDAVGAHTYSYNYGTMGVSVIGTHGNYANAITPTVESLTALADIVAWEANRSYVHPLEDAFFRDKVTANIAGHRDYNSTTTCPGDLLYAELPGLRAATWERITTHADRYRVEWLGWQPLRGTLYTNRTYSIEVGVRNVGWFPWPQGGPPNAVRLGYHWIDGSGQRVVQPEKDDHRGPLPYDVTFGHTYTHTPALLTTPITPGTYTLEWDMVHEGVAWFHDANPDSPALTMTLSVAHPFTVTGRVTNVYGQALPEGEVLASGGHAARAASSGAYTMVLPLTGTYALTASAPGYASLPPAYAIEPPMPGEVTYSFVLPPLGYADVLSNGHFEGGLEGWTLGSHAAPQPVLTSTAHTGLAAVQLAASDPAAWAWLSQTVTLTPPLQSWHLSLLYAPLTATEGAILEVSVISGTVPVTYALPLTVAGWTNAALDLPPGLGEAADLELALTQSVSVAQGVSPTQGPILTPTTVLIDEVQLGRRLPRLYLPLVLGQGRG